MLGVALAEGRLRRGGVFSRLESELMVSTIAKLVIQIRAKVFCLGGGFRTNCVMVIFIRSLVEFFSEKE